MASAPSPSRPATGWTTVPPAEAGFDDRLEARFDAARSEGKLPNLHGVVAERGGRIVFERYLPGPDDAWGRPLGTVAFGPDTLHDLRSVTKSIVGLLYGIALAAGRVPPAEAGLMAQFPDYPDFAREPGRDRLTVAHALTMMLGTAWDESLPCIGRLPLGAGEAARPEPWIGATGNGGQRLFLLPGLDLVVAITAGNYNMPDQWRPSLAVLREVILASLRPG